MKCAGILKSDNFPDDPSSYEFPQNPDGGLKNQEPTPKNSESGPFGHSSNCAEDLPRKDPSKMAPKMEPMDPLYMAPMDPSEMAPMDPFKMAPMDPFKMAARSSLTRDVSKATEDDDPCAMDEGILSLRSRKDSKAELQKSDESIGRENSPPRSKLGQAVGFPLNTCNYA